MNDTPPPPWIVVRVDRPQGRNRRPFWVIEHDKEPEPLDRVPKHVLRAMRGEVSVFFSACRIGKGWQFRYRVDGWGDDD